MTELGEIGVSGLSKIQVSELSETRVSGLSKISHPRIRRPSKMQSKLLLGGS